MTDVSTYIEAEDYAETFYEKYYNINNSQKINNHTTVYIDSSDIINSFTCVASPVVKNDANTCNTS